MIGAMARKARAALDVTVAVRAVARSRRRVARRPVGLLVGKTDQPFADLPSRGLSVVDQRCADRWGVAVDRALRLMPGDSACLVRSGALHELVVGRGLPRAMVRIGVRRGPDGFEAHAWVEQDGTPIAEIVRLRGAFSPLDGVTLR